MPWEAITALSTAFTGIVIAITALAAVREVRLTAESTRAAGAQIEELRKATQFEGALEIFKELDSPIQLDARRFVFCDLPERLKDEHFREEVGFIGAVDEAKHQELMVLRCFERIGFYQAKGFVETDVLMMAASGRIVTMWIALQPVVEIHRRALGSRIWENFEALYNHTQSQLAERGFDVSTAVNRVAGDRTSVE
jgi:hypothetical protein